MECSVSSEEKVGLEMETKLLETDNKSMRE
jgi:hypothetical protein